MTHAYDCPAHVQGADPSTCMCDQQAMTDAPRDEALTDEESKRLSHIFCHGSDGTMYDSAIVYKVRQLLDRRHRAPSAPQKTEDWDLRDLWRNAGGSFHGPNVEHGSMPEEKLLPFLRSLVIRPEPPQ